MRTITRQGKSIIIHKGRQAYIHYHRKARSRGYTTLWTGNGMICMAKTEKRSCLRCGQHFKPNDRGQYYCTSDCMFDDLS